MYAVQGGKRPFTSHPGPCARIAPSHLMSSFEAWPRWTTISPGWGLTSSTRTGDRMIGEYFMLLLCISRRRAENMYDHINVSMARPFGASFEGYPPLVEWRKLDLEMHTETVIFKFVSVPWFLKRCDILMKRFRSAIYSSSCEKLDNPPIPEM